MQHFNIAIKLSLKDDASHPRKWLAEAITENLDFANGEDLTDIEYFSDPITIGGIIDTLDDQITNVLHENYTKVKAEQLGLDPRAGYSLYINRDEIVVHSTNSSSLNYYGGFEYIPEERVTHLCDYIVYTGDRVETALDFYYSPIDAEEETEE